MKKPAPKKPTSKPKKKKLTKADFTPKFTAKGTCQRDYPIIPNSTLIEMMGQERWDKLVGYIKKKYKSVKIELGCHQQGCGAEVYVNGTHICKMADLEAQIPAKKKKGKKNGK